MTSVNAVTDAELEALEKQIEQQEVEEKRQAEEEAKRIAEENRKLKAEKKRFAEEKIKRKAEEKAAKEEEERRINEIVEKRLAEEEMKRKQVSKKKAEEEKKEEARLAELERQLQEDVLVNDCLKIIGVWRWNDLSRTTTRFYEDGKVVSRNLLKSEGTWECIEPKNRIFTSNTWGKKRQIKMSDDAKQLESTNAFTGLKLIGIKISDNPLEK